MKRDCKLLVVYFVLSVCFVPLKGCSAIPKTGLEKCRVESLKLPSLPLITLSAQDEKIFIILESLSRKSGVEIVSANDWWSNFPASISVEDAELREVLIKLLGNLNYWLEHETVKGRITRICIHAELE